MSLLNERGLVQIDQRLIEALQERDQQLAEAQRLAHIGSWEWNIVSDAVTFSDELYRIFGLRVDELEPTFAGVLERLHPDDQASAQQVVEASSLTMTPWMLHTRIIRTDGEIRHIEALGEVDADGGEAAVKMHGTVRDRTDSEIVVRSFHHISAAFDLVQRASMAVSAAGDVGAAVRSVLETVCHHCGWKVGRAWIPDLASSTLIAGGAAYGAGRARWPVPSALALKALTEREPEVSSGSPQPSDLRARSTFVVVAAPVVVDDEVVYVLEFEGSRSAEAPDHLVIAALRSICSAIAQLIVDLRDVTARVLAEQASLDALSHDPLTGLSTRQVFREQLERALALQRRAGWCTAVLSIDLDQFHRVNETHGHDGGDEVLIVVADRLRTSLRQHDTTARDAAVLTRIGGDEFLLMCERVRDVAAAHEIASRLLASIAEPVQIASGFVDVTASVGVAMTTAGASPQQTILDAESAQRHAKALGGGRHQFFEADQHDRATAASALVEELRRAVARSEFFLVYQPKISMATNRIVGVEALLRWQHPERGVVMPADFIPAAEQSGVIVPIGAWLVGESARQAAVWRAAYPRTSLQLAINVSARQFRTDLVATIRSAITAAGLESSTVRLEMTETTVMDDIDATVEILDELKERGFTISIDDFGTGYSSLEYLHRMPIDEVKIDRTFVARLGPDEVNTAIVASVISLAHAMHLDVVAEGVETIAQLEHLRTLGCDFAQGFVIARPATADVINVLLADDAAGYELPRREAGADVARAVTDTVLVVDDASDVRMLARMSLTAAGFAVQEAGNGGAALALARALIPQCIVLDVGMPDVSGIEVCKELRADPALSGCTIVMLTAHSNATDKAEAFLAGADDYIVKPFAPRDLVARVQSAIRHRLTNSNVAEQVDRVLVELLAAARTRELDDSGLESEHLSDRQLEVLTRLLRGERVPGIAAALYLSQSTVRNHLGKIYRQLGVHSQEELLTMLRNKSSTPPS